MSVYASLAREWRNLADAPALGAGARKGVGVRIPPLAHALSHTFSQAQGPYGVLDTERTTSRSSDVSTFNPRASRVREVRVSLPPQDPKNGRQDRVHR